MGQDSNEFSVAISTYNAFNHLRVNLDIIRHNWRQMCDVPIVLSSNHPEVEKEVMGLRLDRLVMADASIPWTRDGGKTTDKIGFRVRALDCIQHGCQAALELGTRYTIHTHADGWILSAEKVLEITNYMKRNGKVLAAGGWGLDYHIQRYNIDQRGELDDYFFVIDNGFARRTGFWDFKAKYGDRVRGHVWYLVARFLELAGPDRLYHYQDYKGNEVEFGGTTPRNVKPWRYDDRFKMLHIDDFVRYRDIVSDIFRRNGITEGVYVQRLLAGELSWQGTPPVELRLNWREKIKDKAEQLARLWTRP